MILEEKRRKKGALDMDAGRKEKPTVFNQQHESKRRERERERERERNNRKVGPTVFVLPRWFQKPASAVLFAALFINQRHRFF